MILSQFGSKSFLKVFEDSYILKCRIHLCSQQRPDKVGILFASSILSIMVHSNESDYQICLSINMCQNFPPSSPHTMVSLKCSFKNMLPLKYYLRVLSVMKTKGVLVSMLNVKTSKTKYHTKNIHAG